MLANFYFYTFLVSRLYVRKKIIMCVVAIISTHEIKYNLFIIAGKCNRWRELWIEKRKKSISKTGLCEYIYFSLLRFIRTHSHSQKNFYIGIEKLGENIIKTKEELSISYSCLLIRTFSFLGSLMRYYSFVLYYRVWL